jgi:hypothetical protein
MESSGIGVSSTKDMSADEQVDQHAPEFRVRCFEEADRWFTRLVRLMTALHEGFWLGCLSADGLNRVTVGHFGKSQYFASKEHNLSGLFDWEVPVIDRYFRRGSRILVAGAGAGREVLALRKEGFDADGFECSLPLILASQRIFDELGESKHLVHCAPDDVPPGPAIYDGVIVGWGVYAYIPTRLRRILFLQSLRERARPHSPLLISFFAERSGSWDESVVYRTAALTRLLLGGRKEPLELGDHLEDGRYFHRFTRDEMEEELKTAGFRLAHYAEDIGDEAICIARVTRTS